MTSLNQLKRMAEQVEGARASIEYDEAYGAYVEVSARSELPLDELDRICDETGALMKVEGINPMGEHEYLLR